MERECLRSRAARAARAASGLVSRAAALAPRVGGAGGMRRAARAEEVRLGGLARAERAADVAYEQVVGSENNVAGLEAQLSVAEALDAAGLLHAVEAGVSSKPLPGEDLKQSAHACGVDVVACGGGAWLEVKWAETAHDAARLAAQVKGYKACAAARRNWDASWRSPAVIVVLAGAPLDERGVAALREAGADAIVQPGGDVTAALPPPPPPPRRAVLCLTTLCALVSSISHGAAERDGRTGAEHEKLRTLRARRPEWYECSVEAERREPILPILLAALDGKELWTTRHIIGEFERVVERSASVAERKRWEELRARLRVSDAESAVAVAVAEERLASGNKGNARNARSVFACADALHAMAVTANAKAYRSLESTGFALPALLHRPVWLSGI